MVNKSITAYPEHGFVFSDGDLLINSIKVVKSLLKELKLRYSSLLTNYLRQEPADLMYF